MGEAKVSEMGSAKELFSCIIDGYKDCKQEKKNSFISSVGLSHS